MNAKNILTAPFITEIAALTDNMYRLGWDEKNSGNVSCILNEKSLKDYLDLSQYTKHMVMDNDFSSLSGKYFLVTGSGKYFKNVSKDPADTLSIIRIGSDGKTIELLWGLSHGGRPTSELETHLLAHEERLKQNRHHKVVIHTHPTAINAMNLVEELDEKNFTRKLWQTSTEAIVVFEEGVGILPWIVCGTYEIGRLTAEKLREFRFVIWTAHGVLGTGENFDDAFGLIETVEKVASIYMMASTKGIKNYITVEQLRALVKRFSLNPKEEYLKD